MQKSIFNFLIISFLVFIVQCNKDSENADDKPIILAKVNGIIITLKDFQKKYDRIKASYDPVSLKINKNLETLKKSLLQQMITTVVLKDEAKQMNIEISDQDLETHIESIKKQYTTQQFRQMMIQKNISFADWKEEQKDYLIIKKLTERIIADVSPIPEKELMKYYKDHITKYKRESQVRIRQIVVKSNTVANDILRKIKRGEKFEEMAKQYSLSPDAKEGGDIGWFEQGQKIPEFDMAFDLSLNRVSKVIKSPYGFHIIKVIDKKPAMVLSFSQVKDKIIKELSNGIEDEIYRKWLEKKISDSKIYQNNKLLALIK